MRDLRIYKDEKICMFTGHRTLDKDFNANELMEAIEEVVKSGVTTFVNGLAVGFDLLAAEFILSLKVILPQIRLIACIPCREQDKYYSAENKQRYYNVTSALEDKIVLSERYYNGCMQVRDKFMAEQADCAIAYCKRAQGGTAYTVRCFEKLHPDGKIIFL